MLIRHGAWSRLEMQLPEAAYQPLGFAAGDTNLYRFVGNDPVNEIDPSGDIPVPPSERPFPANKDERELAEAMKAPTYQVVVGGHKLGNLTIKGDSDLIADYQSRLRDYLQIAIERITATNHFIEKCWSCLEKVALAHRQGFSVWPTLRDNRAYYEKVFHQAADKLLSGKATLAIYVKESQPVLSQIKGSETPAYSYPRTTETIWISKYFFPMLKGTKPEEKEEAIHTLVHELGRVYADQNGEDHSAKNGDVYVFDAIVDQVNRYRSEIEACIAKNAANCSN